MAWRALRGCSVMEANLASGLLEDAGIRARVVDGAGNEFQRDYLAPIDYPVIVEVQDTEHTLALAFLDEALPAKKRPIAESSAPAPRDRDGAEAIGLRIRYCALTPFAVYGLWNAPRYLARVRATGRPRGHAWNLAGIAVSALTTCAFAFLIFRS